MTQSTTTYDVELDAKTITLTETKPAIVQAADGSREATTETNELVFEEIETRTVNKFARFEAEAERFASTVSDQTDRARLWIVTPAGDLHELTGREAVHIDYNGPKFSPFDGVELSKESNSTDRHRSWSKWSVRIFREAIEEFGELWVLETSQKNGGSRDSPSHYSHKPVSATRLVVEE